MNFAYDSLKLKSKVQNEDFCFDIETGQGHFFAVLDFAPHDYANLNATLKGKLETVVGSFASLSEFSADLFLGFVAKEINNFLHHLGEQSSGPEILCSAALCLVGGNRLSYLICGNVRIDVTGGRLLSLSGELPEPIGDSSKLYETKDAGEKTREPDHLGADRLEAPLTDRVNTLTLQDDDVVLIMTHGLEAGVDPLGLSRELASSGSPEPKLICDAVMDASASSHDDRTVVVIVGPYEHHADPVLSELSKSIASLEARVSALADNDAAREAAAHISQREFSDNLQRQGTVVQQLEALTAGLMGKAPRAELAQVDERIGALTEAIGKKADSAEVSGIKQDILKLSKAADARVLQVETNGAKESGVLVGRSSLGWALLLVLTTAIAAAFIGAWLHSRVFKKAPEVWAVNTAANQIVIRRLDGTSQEGERTVRLNVSEPLTSTGEQTFSSFADVTRYIDTITNPASAASSGQANPTNQPGVGPSPEVISEITVEPGDTLKKFAERYNVAQEKIKELNPTITRWPLIQSGQKIKVPSALSANPTAPPTDQPVTQPASDTASATIEVTVGPGDSLNRFVERYNSTPERLRELNPQITNWAAIRAGQKLLVPSPPG